MDREVLGRHDPIHEIANRHDSDNPRDPTRTLEYGLDLYENVQRLKLNPARIAPVHGRVVPFENLKIAIGVSKSS